MMNSNQHNPVGDELDRLFDEHTEALTQYKQGDYNITDFDLRLVKTYELKQAIQAHINQQLERAKELLSEDTRTPKQRMEDFEAKGYTRKD